jgi:hypothetical protein
LILFRCSLLLPGAGFGPTDRIIVNMITTLYLKLQYLESQRHRIGKSARCQRPSELTLAIGVPKFRHRWNRSSSS